jgi:uncharacterized protein YbjT (DUF2867 family)
MSQQKVIAVIGATGAQGGGLARAILAAPESEFALRALTRNPNSPKAQELAAQGAEVVAFDVDNPESVREAFDGAYGAFCVTFFWDHFSPELELKHAANMANAAAAAGLHHVIWSTLEDTRRWVSLDDDRMPTLMGKYKVPHFDAKGEADNLFGASGVPVTFLLTSFYWDNFVNLGMGPTKQADGSRSITLPMGDKKLPGIAAEDIGKCAFGIFRDPGTWAGKHVGIAGEHVSGAEMAAILGEVIGEPVSYNAVPPEVYRGFGFPGAEDLGNMFQFKHDFNEIFRAARNVETSRALNPDLKSFSQWASENRENLL